MMKNLKKFFYALILVAGLLIFLTAVEFNWSMINTNFVNLSVLMHILRIVFVALVIISNKNILVDYTACATLLIIGVKPANEIINRYFGKITGVLGAVVPVLILIAMVVIIVALFYMAYKTNHIAVGKTLVVLISGARLVASIVVGFLVNVLVENNGGNQIGLVAESFLAVITTGLMIAGFFLTKEDLAKVTIVIVIFLTWYTIINEMLVSRFVDKLINIKSYTLKGILPIMMAMLAIELLRVGLVRLLEKTCPSEEESDGEKESSPEE